MNYKETLEWLFSQLPMYQRIGQAAYKADLTNTIELDSYFNHPHTQFKSIHVAGTNGKGSVSHMLASVLQASGYKVGLYTSPHLKDFRERIKINGVMIPESFVTEFVTHHKQKFEELKPSFFEMSVAMAFDYFEKSNIDLAVVEVGMGGRLDSTNIIQPEVSVITNIGFDHTQFLGKTLREIAGEKAGIIKTGIPVVIGETHAETEPVFRKVATDKYSRIEFADQYYKTEYSMQTVNFKQVFNISKNGKNFYTDLKVDLLGLYQRKNILTVLRTIDLFIEKGFNIDLQSIYSGMENAAYSTGLMGRWQVINQNPLIVCDTGHNFEGISYVVEQIKNTPYKKLHIVFGVVEDKSIDKILEILPEDATYYFTQASIPRALNHEILKQKAEKYKLFGNSYPLVKLAIENAKINAGANDLIFIGGSTFVVADAL
ncbi:MAG: dihydrofolate synthase [Bacteroidetes bacterium GWC2_33_15]|nr:MAG: dihydrofolate synthase [Bacteroidetes bacterium GWA2_33_15]OFX48809.1 MAG: dihydrofolate synthase [Bacteroidetes bacterium GWC2_33_15]OFX66051.1 MAG: dihydrofolate synthase [Bacteroidetes bacterium GWB2_32_14]OFX68187.1 MAG: dihydrofolate synthase [Bacteroidetes bacterium GWD2_33_33]HAN17962.1 dihydrofolate synthase [Bacteroidales bacterium]